MKSYPLRSLEDSLKVAEAINDMGGVCSPELVADKLGFSPKSGGFFTLMGAANTFGLIDRHKKEVSVSNKFRDYKLSYTDEDARKVLASIFLEPSVFKSIYDRFEGKEVPADHLSKLLIREFDVRNGHGTKVAKIFMTGAKKCGIMNDQNVISNFHGMPAIDDDQSHQEDANNIGSSQTDDSVNSPHVKHQEQDFLMDAPDMSQYVVRVKGPDMDSRFVIDEEYDLVIVETILNKIKMKLSQKDIEQPNN